MEIVEYVPVFRKGILKADVVKGRNLLGLEQYLLISMEKLEQAHRSHPRCNNIRLYGLAGRKQSLIPNY